MKFPSLKAVDLILFWGIFGTVGVIHSLLLTNGTPWESVSYFYIITWIAALAVLAMCLIFWGTNVLNFYEPLNRSKLWYVLGGFVAILFISSILVRVFTKSSIWVPQPRMSLTIGQLSLNDVVNDLYYQLGLVCNSEETSMLALMLILKKYFETSQHATLKKGAFYSAIILTRAGWATLHAYISYTGALMPILVASAFISGCIMSWCAYNGKVKCFLVAVLIHFAFNGTMVILGALGA
jgi:hypothetical protein